MEVIFFDQAKKDVDFWKKSGQKQIMTRITKMSKRHLSFQHQPHSNKPFYQL